MRGNKITRICMLPRSRHLLWLFPLLALAGAILLPLPERFLDRKSTSVLLLERSGQELYEVRKPTHGSQQWIGLNAIPKPCISALLAIEDHNFYTHPGVSIKGIARALWQNLSAGRIVSGGSTITQQLARITLNTRERTLSSKVLEALFALKLEQTLTKDDILERYLNTAYFGHRAYGLSAATRTFFGKSVHELSTAECTLLAGLPQSPSALDPFINFTAARERQGRVLTAMRDQGALTEAQIEQIESEPIALTADQTAIRAPHFVMWLLNERPEDLQSPTVTTTLDLTLQTAVERIIERKLEELKEKNVTSAAVVVLDAKNGDILAMVGSADYFDEEHDGAVNSVLAARQSGSALKPFTYALALARGDTAATTVADTAVQFLTREGTPYTPRNYDYLEHGLVRYREALANSYNIAAVRVAERVGIDSLLSFLRSAGLSTLTKTPEHYGLALTLGDAEVRLLELAQAFAIFPRGGETLPIRTLLSDPTQNGAHILDPKVAWLITDILSDASARLSEFGEGGPLTFDFPVAAKTGTTRNSRDNWTVGFTPDRIVGVWVGNADNSPMRETSGVTGAGPIFHDVVLAATKNLPMSDFAQPEGLKQVTICRLSGKLPTELCPHTIEEWFIAGTEPKEPDDLYRLFEIDRRNGLLSNKYCDQEFVDKKGLAVFPKDTEKWGREQGWPLPPTRVSPLCGDESPTSDSSAPGSASWIEIISPQPNESYLLDPLIPDAQEQVIFEAHASPAIRTMDWYVDGKKIGAAQAPDFRIKWQPQPGRHQLTAQSGEERAMLTFEVLAR
ncbi:MAG TPA: penicillin-binding protein 1C [Candidatus Peribacter riflensis]|uniref:1A family penicillin-binding protein n=1 Tax=Candidatus Peribacter riflensis TaxID=1735162 RepID=A0A0S1SL12_9BACT|nr:MAG: 1A family penicillin-binding protein [Candidatus Peribacter riflensis]OGJ78306.1 MAG: penicillin-binding protein 1C [Candidatus Peribacteria bacterium RIFOXYB1_FULL_57_12]OGJ82373.1 MAG: penicillin-binding protein 1C [Candidatus Peribacteria bacterium RIFOXYC1_FULL_58_8]ALM10837.1 MAG: 1A family penicillin-binding protein [Candidatus Peribacter riflensis]ALM11939.1 MAG: 1A family penicillin-binding protein [Candidatus Peribacter riflensis]